MHEQEFWEKYKNKRRRVNTEALPLQVSDL